MHRFLFPFLAICVAVVTGCAESANDSSVAYSPATMEFEDSVGSSSSAGLEPTELGTASVKQQDVLASRQLIYTARITVEASEINSLSQSIHQFLPSVGGFVAQVNQVGIAGDHEQADWTLRIPSKNFQAFLSWLEKQTTVLQKQIETQDVTEQYTDLNARLQNKQKTEQRLLALLEERGEDLEKVLVVEKEIDRVRESIEQMQGAIRLLDDRISLSTIHLTVLARSQYQPLAQAGLLERTRMSWKNSWGTLTALLTMIVLGIVSLIPWVIALLLLNIPLLIAWRVSNIRRTQAT